MDLVDRWAALTVGLGLAPEETVDLRDDLLARYGEPQRAYHDASHIAQCLQELEETNDLADDATAVALAVWYHDAIYDPRAADNETRSADLFRGHAERLGLSRDRSDRIAGMIEATAHAGDIDGSDCDPDTALLLDVDLAILGQPEAVYDRYEAGVRSEYAWVEPARFTAGRRAILSGFLARPRIYLTGSFYRRYEAAARENLERALARLGTAA